MKKNVKKNIVIIITIFILIIIIYILSNANTKENFTNNNEAYVINLDERRDRWEQIQNSFAGSSIKLNRISAVKHNNGHIGCGLSFMKIIKLAKEKNLKTVLIFEDDNKPLDNFDDRWNIIKNWLDNNLDKWEIFNGGARFDNWDTITNDKIPDSCKTIKLAYNIDNKEYLFKNDIMVALNWIYVNSSVYDKILEWENNSNKIKNFSLGKHPVDRYITDIKNFNHVFCLPVLALQQNGESDTSELRRTYFNFNKTDKYIINVYKEVYKNRLNFNI